MTSASKVGELFTAAGEAFTKLSELTRVIQTTLNNSSNDCSTGCNSKSCWSTEDTELLQLAVKRFGDELNIISEHIKDKTMCQIKSTFKKIQPTITNTCKTDDSTTNSHEMSYSTTTAAVTATISSFNEFSTNSRSSMFSAEVVPTVTSVVNRPQLLTTATLSSPSVVNANLVPSTQENIGLKAASTITVTSVTTTTSTIMANVATASATRTTSGTVVVSSSMLSPQTGAPSNLSATTVASSICSSPSPFLHYPLLRKSADITLNMLNARDDSDEEDRIGSLSLFNNV